MKRLFVIVLLVVMIWSAGCGKEPLMPDAVFIAQKGAVRAMSISNKEVLQNYGKFNEDEIKEVIELNYKSWKSLDEVYNESK